MAQAGSFCFSSDKCRSRAFRHLGTEVLVALSADVDNPQSVPDWRLLLVEWNLEMHGHFVGAGLSRGMLHVVGDDANAAIGLQLALCEHSLSRFGWSDTGGQRVGALSTFDVHAVK